jgi:hypothetical protein
MKRLGLLTAALFVVCTFGTLTAAAAFAVFLLAEWLVNGVPVTAELLVEGATEPSELLLEDRRAPNGAIDILCSGIGKGWIGPSSLAWGSELLTLSSGSVKVLVATEVVECVNDSGCPSPLVWPVNLGYENEVELLEQEGLTFFMVLTLPHAGGGNPGYEIECMGIIPVTDECTASESVEELRLEGAKLLAVASAAITELAGLKLATCSLGGAESAVLEGEGTVSLVEGGELSASSETAVS